MKHEFDRVLDSQLNSLEESIKSGNKDVDALLQSIEKAQVKLKDHLDVISTHDREKYDSRLQQARERIWKLKKPQRFQFKSSALAQNKAEMKRVPQASVLHHRTAPRQEEKTTPALNRTVLFEPDEHANLSFADLERSVVVASNVTGSLHLTQIHNSKVIVKCAQCRIHDCTDLDVHIEGCKNPVIENSSRIHFYATSPQTMQISDFSWMRSDASPNFSLESLPHWSRGPASSYTLEDAHELSVCL